MDLKEREYELSVWSSLDLLKSSRKETKLAVIGSSKNKSPLYAYDVHYIPNINGQKKLTFSMHFLYEDEEEERKGVYDLKNNPFCEYLANEARVKLYFQDEWNEFIIRSQEKSRDGFEIAYTCEDADALELAKTGYNIEFSSELYNNTGTVEDLAKATLKGSDWEYSEDSDIPVQLVAEPLYQLRLLQNVTFKRMDNNKEITLPAGSLIYSFYDTVINQRPYFQMIYKVNGADFEVDDDNVAITDTNYYTDGTLYQNVGGIMMPSFCDYMTLYKKCRGNRIVRKQESKYDDVSKEVVKVYQDKNGNRYYGYTKNNYTVDDIVVNYFTNPTDFVADSSKLQPVGWLKASDTSENPETTVQPSSTVKMNGLDYEGYIKLPQGTYINSGITDHLLNLPDGGFTVGERYAFRARFGVKDGDRITTGFGRTKLTLNVAWYSVLKNQLENDKIIFQTDLTTDDTVYPYGYNVNDDGTFSQKALNSTYNQSRYAYGIGSFTSAVSKAELISGKDFGNEHYRIGLFVTVNGSTAFARDLQFFKFFNSAHTGYPVVPGAQIDLANVETQHYFYREPADGMKKDDIVYGESDPSLYTPVYDNKFQKKMSIEASKTNRFDIIQTICETFQMWAKFYVEHDSQGYVRYNNGKPIKKVVFKKDVGQLSPLGFRYGRDVQSITRTVDSEQIASKVYVEDIESTAAEGGVCSIQRASMNPIGERFLYNFSYYINQGLIDKDELNNDLYNENTGFYTLMKKLTNESKQKVDRYASITNDIAKAKSNKTVYEQYAEEAERQYQKAKNYFELTVRNNAQLETYTLSETDSQEARNYYAQAMYAKQLKEDAGQKAKNYSAQYYSLTAEKESLEHDLIDKDNPNSIVSKKTKLVENFERKYQNFIQEGTWQSDNYLDPDLYYLTAAAVSDVSARPEVSYQLDVVALSALPEYDVLKYHIGDIVSVEDTEYFGYTLSKVGTRVPRKEKIIISEIDYSLNSPDDDKISVQNYKDKFESLFSRISAATKQLEYNQKAYSQIATSFNADGSISEDTLQKSLKNGAVNYSTSNETIHIDENGITASSPSNGKRLVRLDSSGLSVSSDAGVTWSSVVTATGIATEFLSAGVINADNVNIRSGDDFAFKWNKNGIHAFSYLDNKVNINYNTYVRMDRYGLYGVKDGPKAITYDAAGEQVTSDASNWVPNSIQEIKDHASFGFTWDGFFIKNKYRNGYVEIGNDNDIRVVETDNNDNNPVDRIKIGALAKDSADPSKVTSFGIEIRNKHGAEVFHTDSEGGVRIVANTLEIVKGNATNYNAKIEMAKDAVNITLSAFVYDVKTGNKISNGGMTYHWHKEDSPDIVGYGSTLTLPISGGPYGIYTVEIYFDDGLGE